MSSLSDRLFSRCVVDINECWLWQRRLDRDGYGRTTIASKMVRPHRVMYEELVGVIPDGLEIDHLCRVRNCCNPAHLEVVTKQENARRGYRPAMTSCRKCGSPLAEGNVSTYKGRRSCLNCRRMTYAQKTKEIA